MQKCFGIVMAVMFGVAAANASDRYVALNGQTPSPNCESWDTAASNIQDAVDVANPGETVWVSNGVYNVGGVTNYPTGSILTNRVAIWKAITVRSANNDPTNTVIKGAGPVGDAAVRCVYLANGSSLIGFMLTNGATLAAADWVGGGAYCQSTSAILSNCVIAGSTAYVAAGGVYRGTLYHCQIINNRAEGYTWPGGGGAAESALYDCELSGNYSGYCGGGAYASVLSNCTVSGNTAYNLAGGAYVSTLYNCKVIGGNYSMNGGGMSECVVYNSLVVGNSSYNPGGGAVNSTLNNCTLSANGTSAADGGGVNNCTLTNCISWGNGKVDSSVTAHYSCGDGYSGDNNISSDPRFLDAAGGDYRLWRGSPCVNKGIYQSWMNLAKDLDGNPRVMGGAVDMGAYETFPPKGTLIKIM